MSERERLIVYPLLFFALLMAGRDQVEWLKPLKSEIVCSTLQADVIVCSQLQAAAVGAVQLEAINPQGDSRVRLMNQAGAGGRIDLFGAAGTPLLSMGVGESGKAGILESRTDQGTILVRFTTNAYGGVVDVRNREGDTMVQIGSSSDGGHVVTNTIDSASEPDGALQEAPDGADQDHDAPSPSDDQNPTISGGGGGA